LRRFTPKRRLSPGTEGALIDEGLGFSVDLTPGPGGLVGYRAKPHAGVIDLTRIGAHDVADFWEEVRAEGPDGAGHVILDPGAFYILVSREAVSIPPDCAAEMAPYIAMVGEFRVHYAGFFDPGFGHGVPARGVLEVRCHEAPFVLEHGQVVGRLVYERMAAPPDQLYGADLKSNYQGQGLKLSKHFPHRDFPPECSNFGRTTESCEKRAVSFAFETVRVSFRPTRRRPTDLSDRRHICRSRPSWPPSF
jgi:deoxycytidine triphosphate deaminase